MFDRARLFVRRILGHIRNTVKYDVPRAFLTRKLPADTRRLIIFLTPGYELRSGGVMAINAMYHETVALKEIHQAESVLCSIPGEPRILKYKWFKNNDYILGLSTVLGHCRNLESVLIHIPEYRVNHVAQQLSQLKPLLEKIPEVHLNVLLFNIDLIEEQNVKQLEEFGRVTCTTAHEGYSNQETRDAVGVPTHGLLICKGAEYYTPTKYEQKDELLIVSPDAHPLKERVLERLARELPRLKVQIIQDLAYEEYAKVRQRAKWSLTFGEGLDGFFVEVVFCGGLSFAVFNERFFTQEFSELENVYPSWEALLEKMPVDLKQLDDPQAYESQWKKTFALVDNVLSTNRFRERLRQFYRGEYTFP